MNIQAKQRVVGAVVLVSLGVIFLPILLPGKGDVGSSLDSAEMPPVPDYRFPPLPSAPQEPGMDKGVSVPLEIAEQAPAEMPATESPVGEKSAVVSPPAAKPVVPTPGQQKAPPATEKQVSGWIVQVGSFSSQNNANALRDKLRGQGYACFVEKQSASGQATYRVRVGPELSRTAADRLQQKLMKDAKLSGLVQQYP